MSLSSHLEKRESPIRSFLYSNVPSTLQVVKRANAKLRAAETVHPKEKAPELARVRPAVFTGSADISGADADLILDTCLLDIKTMIKPRVQNRNLYQLLGYVLLDFKDEYELDEVGFYFSRQGATVRWPLTDLLDHLCTDVPRPRLTELRERFHAVLLEDVTRRFSSRMSGLGPNPVPLIPPAWIADQHPAKG